MKPRTSPPAIMIETEAEAGILASYFTGAQPDAFQEAGILERRERLIGELHDGRDLGKLPVAVSVEDVTDIVLPAVDFGLNELMGRWYASKPLADYRAEVSGHLDRIAS